MRDKSLAFIRAGFAVSFRFRNGGLLAHGAGRYPCEQGRILYGPNVAAPHRMRGMGSSCELKFIGKFKETESPSNDAMVSGASKFPGY